MSAVACRPRRLSDPLNPSNFDIHDAARGLVVAVELVDQMGIEVIRIEADRRRNQRVFVAYCPACDRLEGVETSRSPDYSLWTANRFGIEIRWMRQPEDGAS